MDEESDTICKGLEGPRVTAEDLKYGTQTLWRCSSAQWFNLALEDRTSGGSGSRGAGDNRYMGFGRHAKALMVDVREDDPGYWRWCLNEMPGFVTRARKAGLLEDDDL